MVTPLSARHDTEAVFQFFHNVLSAQQLTINWTIVMPRHRTAHPSEPPEDDLVTVLPRTSYPTLPSWIDNLVTKINHLVQLLTNADDLPRSSHGLESCFGRKELSYTKNVLTPKMFSGGSLLYMKWSLRIPISN